MKDIDVLIAAKLRASQFDLTKNQLILLRCISMGVKSQSELSVITHRNKSSLTRLVQGMEKKGLVERTMSESDKRHQVVVLTEDGKTLYEQAMPVVEACFKQMESGLTKKQVEQTKEILFRMQQNVEKELENL